MANIKKIDLPRLGRFVDLVGPETPGARFSEDREEDCFAYLSILQLQHLEFPHDLGRAEEIVKDMREATLDYFFGDWRDKAWTSEGKFNRKKCRKQLDWTDPFREGCLANVLARSEGGLSKLCTYIGDDLAADEGFWDRTKDDCLGFAVLAKFIASGSLDSSEATRLARSRRKRPKLFLDVLRAIENGDAAAFRTSMESYMRQYMTVEIEADTLMVASVDGSFLWGLAEMRLPAVDQLDEDLMELVITRQSLGID